MGFHDGLPPDREEAEKEWWRMMPVIPRSLPGGEKWNDASTLKNTLSGLKSQPPRE